MKYCFFSCKSLRAGSSWLEVNGGAILTCSKYLWISILCIKVSSLAFSDWVYCCYFLFFFPFPTTTTSSGWFFLETSSETLSFFHSFPAIIDSMSLGVYCWSYSWVCYLGRSLVMYLIKITQMATFWFWFSSACIFSNSSASFKSCSRCSFFSILNFSAFSASFLALMNLACSVLRYLILSICFCCS